MALQALNPENFQPTCQALLAFLDREDVTIPGNLLESIVSGKSLLRALLQGQLTLAQDVPQPQAKAVQERVEEAAAKAQEAEEKAA